MNVRAVVPATPSISSSPSGNVEDDTSLTMTCTTSTSITSPKYIWSINGVDQAAETTGSLTVTADIDNVVPYTCKVSADGGTEYSPVSGAATHTGKDAVCCCSVVLQL